METRWSFHHTDWTEQRIGRNGDPRLFGFTCEGRTLGVETRKLHLVMRST